jgi:hypothetical protein
MNLSSTIKIPFKATETGSFKQFIVPPCMDPGDYLVNVFVLLDGKEVGAMYSTRSTI